jgi:cytidine deaminase
LQNKLIHSIPTTGTNCSAGREVILADHVGVAGRLASVTTPANRDLILSAAEVLNPHTVGDRLFGNVASELIASSGTHYQGVCIDTGSGTGFCAEHSAIAAMVTAGEYRIDKIVAVWRGDEGLLYVLPPCGRCREFIRQVDPTNIDTRVVLDLDRSAPLRELLPAHDWPHPLDLS